MSETPLIKTPRLLILDIFVGPTQLFGPSTPLIWYFEEYVFQNRDDPRNNRVREKEMKRQIFGLIYRSVRLWSFASS